ncbi:galactose-1-phosphate uridylyltransferase [Blastopirellula sp. J2-11]|uniref:galactose-1-phosphate uridylyltransferase n=1 Tax=Blastopirellula sp. J2-11 TaxID=2943192 RepID=UPI0021CAAF7F|nr:galactose-1-phosphate uridylyltransferase [Blastopirellula sp. J2-11]UUO07797.1 galactose-1-phosphate uridylyltransferase [Blastopirellula sp. J2-11]
MSEIRRDPLLGYEVVIAARRAERPQQFDHSPSIAKTLDCPFCEGAEQLAPPELWAARPHDSPANGPGWQVRVVPNRFPAFEREEQSGEAQCGDEFFPRQSASGWQDVVIESPQHQIRFSELSPENARLTFVAYQARLNALKKEGRYAYAQIFKNVGAAGGASLEHSHSQIMATERTPLRVQEELKASRDYFHRYGRSYWAELIERELAAAERVVYVDDHFVAFCPFASRVPLETWILPRRADSDFCGVDLARLEQLAQLTQRCLSQIENALEFSAYNYLIHTTPFDINAQAYYHWRLVILPRATTQAGFEWGTGMFVNPLPPEQAAAMMRSAQ